MQGSDVWTDSGDTICTPIENGGGIKKLFQYNLYLDLWANVVVILLFFFF